MSDDTGGFSLTAPTQSDDNRDSAKIYARNQAWTKQGAANFQTKLSGPEEEKFQKWIAQNKVPFDPSPTADYDMRGFWKGLESGDPKAKSAVDPNDKKLHYPDYWKTPYHETFSNESQWADPAKAPKWTGDDKLVTPSGAVIFDDRARPTPQAAESDDTGGFSLAAPAGSKTIADRAAPQPWWKKTMRVGTGIQDVGVGIIQDAAHVPELIEKAIPVALPQGVTDFNKGLAFTVDQAVKDREQRVKEAHDAEGLTGTDWYRTAGNVAGSVPLAALVPGGGVAGAAASGAASAVTQPVTEGNFGLEKLKQAGIGAAAGAGGAVVGNALASVVKPVTNEARKLLMDEGVSLTPGQFTGPAGKQVENIAKILPITGYGIRNAEKNSIETFNRAAINRALAPIGEVLDKSLVAGRPAIADAQTKVSGFYDNLLPKLTFKVDQQFGTEMQSLAKLGQNLPSDLFEQGKRILQNTVGDRMPTGTMDGITFKQADSELGNFVRQYKTSPLAGERQLGDMLQEVRDSMRDTLNRSNPQYAGELDRADEAYAALSRVENAATRRVNGDGVFTPSDLMQSIKSAAGRGGGRKAFARGDAMLQDLADAGMLVLPKSVPEGHMVNALAGGVEGLAALAHPSVLIPDIAGGALYAKPTLNLLRTMATVAPTTRNYLAQTIRQGGGAVAPALGVAATGAIGP